MSAPNQGRQSPEPARQDDSQAGVQANPNSQAGSKNSDHTQNSSSTTTTGDSRDKLQSNVGGPLEQEAKKKTAKGQGQD